MNKKIKFHLWLYWACFLLSLIFILQVLFGNFFGLNIIAPNDYYFAKQLGLRINFLNSLLFFMASSLIVAISHYSSRYLLGEKKYSYFFNYLTIIFISVSIFLLSDNLLIIFLTWLIISFSLQKLLVFFPQRPAAVEAATKKFFVSRIGDLFLASGIYFAFKSLNTFNIFEISNLIQSPNSTYHNLELIAVLISLGAIIKSVQFPFHFWLPETMETPTPVSALMHAGIVNAGGILLIKGASIISNSDIASALLIIFGALSAAFGSLVMITQNNIKAKLAYSTIGQMGMMIFACGLNLYSMALFHIFAHSFYKALAFLSTGLIVEESKKLQCKHKQIDSIIIISILSILLLTTLSLHYILEIKYLNILFYLSVLIIGLIQGLFIGGFGTNYRQAFYKGMGIILIATFIYLIIEYFLQKNIEHGNLATFNSVLKLSAGYVSFLIFGAAYFISNIIIYPKTTLAKNLYVFFWNGAYFHIISKKFFRRFL